MWDGRRRKRWIVSMVVVVVEVVAAAFFAIVVVSVFKSIQAMPSSSKRATYRQPEDSILLPNSNDITDH